MLQGVDSPDPGQNYAEQAKRFLGTLLLNKSVTITIHGKDRYGNRLGEIQIDGNTDPRHELIKEGLAWTSEKEPIAELESLKEQARAEGKGLWKDENPTPPWIYRRQQTLTQQKSS
ncbi:MAG: thermonuclease family protein [Bacteroidota bacterium]